MEEDSFRARVDKAFGSLSSSSSSSSSSSTPLSSLWSLTDEEVQRREWNRESDPPPQDTSPSHPYPSNLDGFCAPPFLQTPKLADFHDQRRSDDEDDDDYSDNCNDDIKRKKPNLRAADDEDFDIRSSIGLDCTLDFEEEEDEYDKVAVGREKAGDRLYMKDIVDYGIETNSHHQLPSSFRNVPRDPRANHMAAKLRLKEDAETAGTFDSLKLSDVSMPPAKDEQVNQLSNGNAPKPILKRKEILPDGKSSKRVRFQGELVGTNDTGEQSSPTPTGGTTTSQREEGNLSQDEYSMGEAKVAGGEVFSLPQNSNSADEAAASLEKGSYSSVPDYVKNPSRYTRYTLDSSDDMDEESNRKACMDLLNLLKKPNAAAEETFESSVCSPKSLIFTPKKKANDTSGVSKHNELKQNQTDISKEKAFPVAIAAEDAEYGGNEVWPMDEDKADDTRDDDKSLSSQKPGRRYRPRNNVNYDDHVVA